MPKIIGTTLADHRELTRQRLFDALGELLAEQSFDSITMSQIAQRADVGRTAVYNHFADKEQLLLAFMRHASADFAETLTAALAEEDDVIEQLCTYIRAHLELRGRFHLASHLDLRSMVSTQGADHLRDHAGVVEHILFHILETAMAQGRIPRQNSLALVSLVLSSLAGQLLPVDPEEKEEAVRVVQAFVLRGIGVPAEECPLPPVPLDPGTAQAPDTPRGGPQAFLRCPVSRS
ncbi:TetR/AcrR family transcriptional regulator [Actinomyces polynesiensis]|uniref:TetR/AcrR family transcriptional regulator n=1 Tax=Actinomyces polynesiensis TaxID=1325934 RepID=UPI0005B80B08|nr:TetR/AcrR family transcriptional regulator [Actinomyces polynesiensis]